jgi:class 3 adenylate cyclase
MSWNYQRSYDRIRTHLDTMGEIEVAKLKREADLEQLLSETTCRDIYGAHVYVQVSNFARLASDGLYAEDDYKHLIQGLHIYERAVTRIVEGLGGLLVHFQGPKLHALFYRPINDGEALATRAVLLQLVLKDFVKTIFNTAFSDCDDFTIAGGTDLGNAIGTMDGINGDRELLFVGAPANHAAKIISTAHRMRLTQQIYDTLPNDLRTVCFQTVDGSYQMQPVTGDRLDTLLKAHGLTWNRDMSTRHVEEDKERFPQEDIAYSSAEVLIEVDDLSIFNNKRVLGASIFADVSGFTHYIDAATSDEKKQEALRVLHAIRKETARVIMGDFNGVRIQYQGDRIQGLFHLPQDDEEVIAQKVVEAAVGLQSSMEHTLKTCLPEAKDLRLAIGIDMGTTLVSKLGARGQRDRICLGEEVECAAQLEERSEGGQIAVSTAIYEILPDELRDHFTYSATVQGFVATNLTAEKVERAARGSKIYRAGAAVFLTAGAIGLTISGLKSARARSVAPGRPYAPDA